MDKSGGTTILYIRRLFAHTLHMAPIGGMLNLHFESLADYLPLSHNIIIIHDSDFTVIRDYRIMGIYTDNTIINSTR